MSDFVIGMRGTREVFAAFGCPVSTSWIYQQRREGGMLDWVEPGASGVRGFRCSFGSLENFVVNSYPAHKQQICETRSAIALEAARRTAREKILKVDGVTDLSVPSLRA